MNFARFSSSLKAQKDNTRNSGPNWIQTKKSDSSHKCMIFWRAQHAAGCEIEMLRLPINITCTTHETIDDRAGRMT